MDGWAKDADANTAFSQTVLPLPFHGMSSYPYPAAEHYPQDRQHQDYLREYNPRPALRLLLGAGEGVEGLLDQVEARAAVELAKLEGLAVAT